jgi:DNA polymerase-3 subunit delta
MPSSRRSESAGVPPVVLLVGEAQALRDVALVAIREQVLAGGPADFNEDRFDFAAGARGADVIGAARTLPVMSERRLVRVRGLEDRRAAGFVETELPQYLEDPVPTTCLLLEARRVDRRLRWVKLVGRLGEVRSCTAPTRAAELRSWVEARVGETGKRAARGMAAALLEQVGTDTDRVANEIDKLTLYVGERKTVAPDDVAAAAGGGRPRAIYELTDAIGTRDRNRALLLLDDLLSQGEAPLALLAGLGNHLRRMLRARECDPLDASTVQRRLGVHPYAAQKLVEHVRSLSRERIRLALDAVARADRALKGAAPLPPARAMERLVLALSQ